MAALSRSTRLRDGDVNVVYGAHFKGIETGVDLGFIADDEHCVFIWVNVLFGWLRLQV